jgi:hypothetical protein
VAVVVLAGCSAAPPQVSTPTPVAETNTTVTVDSAANRTYTVEVRLVPERLTTVSVTSADGVSRPVGNLSAVPGVYAFAPRNATDVRLPVTAASSSEFPLAPGETTTTRLSTRATETTLVVVVRRPTRVVGWASVYCGSTATLDSVDVTLDDRGPFQSVGLHCRSTSEASDSLGSPPA